MTAAYTLSSPAERPIRRRTRRDPKPHFKPPRIAQLDSHLGCLELQVPADHLARSVRKMVDALDVSEAEAHYSSLGRRGYHPRDVLAVWVYASIKGVHHGSQVAEAMRTDAAYRWLGNGYQFSSATLKRFRQNNAVLFASAIEQTVQLAVQEQLIDPADLSVDSLRLRAHASMNELRTHAGSTQRLQQLAQVDTTSLSDEERRAHNQRKARHEDTVRQCEERGLDQVVRTNPLAAKQHFPGGGVRLGHRVTVTAAGRSLRLVVAVLVDADQSDSGKLPSILEQTRAVLLKAGVPPTATVQVTADPGYNTERDLAFAAANASWLDLLTPVDGIDRSKSTKRGFFGRDRFMINRDGTATCPSGRRMRGPYHWGRRRTYEGVDCPTCPLRSQCTEAKKRVVHILPTYDALRLAMRDRMAQDGAAARYKGRAATVEPVFSSIESDMDFDRTSSRHPDTIVAEVLLKILAHNFRRLASARKSSCVLVLVAFEF